MNIIKNDPFVKDLPESAMTMLQTVIDELGYHHDVFLFQTAYHHIARFKKPEKHYNPHFAGQPGRVSAKALAFLAQLDPVEWVEMACDCLVVCFAIEGATLVDGAQSDTIDLPAERVTDITGPATQKVCISEYRDQIAHPTKRQKSMDYPGETAMKTHIPGHGISRAEIRAS